MNSKINNCIDKILNAGGSSNDWSDLLNMVNSKPEEYN
jgi:hypothetical protein